MAKYTIDDIQIFITTHNRVHFITESINSILNQTIGVNELTILDNESSDNTQEIVESLSDRGVKYVKTFGFLGNYKKAKELANKKYIMLFHDDDILHPKYLEYAIEELNKYDDISIITTRYTEFFDNNIPNIPPNVSSDIFLFKQQKEFANFMFYNEVIAYATAIYRTSDFLKCNLEYDKYSKFNDWPLMIKMSKFGKSVLFKDCNLFFCRRHSNQDTWTNTNVPTIAQIINWNKCFYDAMDIVHSNKEEFLKFFNKSLYFQNGKINSFVPQEQRKNINFFAIAYNYLRLGMCIRILEIFKIFVLSKLQNENNSCKIKLWNKRRTSDNK